MPFENVDTYARLNELREQDRPVLLSAYVDDCPFCLSAKAETAIERAHGARVTLVKMSVDKVPELDDQLGIDTIPTLLFLQKNASPQRFHWRPDADGSNVLPWLANKLGA